MARLHYYEFPEGVPADVREANGADGIGYSCAAEPERYEKLDSPSEGCPRRDGFRGCVDCSKIKCVEAGHVAGGISITRAKRLLKEFGGHAYTQHIDRDGGCFEVTPIKLGKNNSRHKYNAHL